MGVGGDLNDVSLIVLSELLVLLEQDQAVGLEVCSLLDNHIIARHQVWSAHAAPFLRVLLADNSARARIHCSQLVAASMTLSCVIESAQAALCVPHRRNPWQVPLVGVLYGPAVLELLDAADTGHAARS